MKIRDYLYIKAKVVSDKSVLNGDEYDIGWKYSLDMMLGMTIMLFLDDSLTLKQFSFGNGVQFICLDKHCCL